MRRPVNWLVIALSLGFLDLGLSRTVAPATPTDVVVERVSFEPRGAVAVPAALKHVDDLQFGYVTSGAATF